MMRLNLHVGLVRTQITNTQNMNNSEMSTQKTHNLHVCSTYKSKSKSIKTGESELHVYYTEKSKLKRVIVNACSLDKSESKSVRISVNMSKIKYAMTETKDE